MSEPFAEATVRVTPSLTRFVTDLNEELKEAMLKVKTPVVRVAPGLEKGFLGNLRTQVNDAITKVQGQVKPIRVRVLIDTPSRRALREVVSGAPVSLPGAVSGGTVVRQAENERLLNSLRAQGAHDLGLLTIAEDKATKVREKATGASKQLVTEEKKVARSGQLIADIRKRTSLIDITAATKTGELRQAQAALAEATKLANLADEARVLHVTKETVALQKAAHAERQLRFERVQAIEARPATPAQTGLARGVQNARAAGAVNLRASVTALRDADAAFATAEQSARGLAAQEAILVQRSEALKAAKLASTAALKAESDTLRVATAATLRKAEADKLASQTAVKSIKDQIALDQKLASARAASLRQQQQATARQTSAEKRRSEQLSRGGQASLLSLAGIRGATLAASRSFLVGAAAITVFANAVRQFADLERNLHVFEATVSATHDEMEAVREEARLLGADLTLPSVTAGDAAGAMVELAKAGLSVADSMAAARSVLQLATAAAIDNAEATRLVANVLNAFSLSGREAVNVADTLANAANAAQGSIADIGTAFQQAASAGRQVGLSFQDTAAFLTILAKNGIRGSDAGTSLRTALIRLINPSKKAKETFQELGISIHDAAGNLRPDVFLQIAAATREMGAAERDATIALIGGQDAFRAVTILGRQSVESFIAMRRALREEGTAAEVAAARTKGLHGSVDALQSILETVGTTMASHVGPGIAGFVYQLGQGITAMSESEEVATGLQGTLDAVATSFDLVGEAIKTVSVVALPLAGGLLAAANAISITTILAGVVAYKSLNAVLDGAILRLRILRPLFGAIAAARFGEAIAASMRGLAAAQAAAAPTVVGFGRLTQVQDQMAKSAAAAAPRASSLGVALRGVGRAALTAATSGNALVVVAAAAAAGIFYLARRENEAERATRHLAEASEELASALSSVQQAASATGISGRSINLAQQGINDARATAAAAKSALVNSAAEKGTFARTKQELALAIALDNVAIAEQRYAEAVRQAEVDSDAAEAAAIRLEEARAKELKSVKEIIQAERRRGALIASRRGRSPGEVAATAEVIARGRLIDILREEAQENRKSEDANTRALGKRQQLFAQVATALDAIPNFTQKQVIFDFNLPNAIAAARKLKEQLAKAGNDAGVAAMESILLGMGDLPERMKNYLGDGAARNAIIEGSKKAGDAGGKAMAQSLLAAFQAGVRRSAGRRAGLAIQEDLAVIASGATGATLSNAQQRLAQAVTDRARAEAEIARLQGAGRTKGLASAREERRRAIAEQRAATEEIRGINDSLASEAEAAANEAESKQNEIFENILKAMGLKRDARQRAIENAELSESKADDIAATRALRKLAAQQIQNLKNRIEAARKQGKNVEVLANALADLKDIWRDLGRDIIDLQKQQREALHDLLFERFELRISIAQSRQDVAAELRARRAKLAELTKELVRMRKQFGKNSIEWLRAKDAQVAEIAAIEELEKTTKTKNSALRQLMFEFLTTQQGFAATLLGNLLPIGAIGGTVGARMDARAAGRGPGVSGVSGAAERGGTDFLRQAREEGGRRNLGGARPAAFAATAGAAAIAPPTRGQASTTNQLLNQILNVLRNTNQNEKHPSSKTQKARGGSSNDVQ